MASRKDCSGKGHVLSRAEVLNTCQSAHQAAPLKTLFIVLPEGSEEYKGGIYQYRGTDLDFITDKETTQYCMEVYPDLILKTPLEMEELVQTGLIWQYLSLEVDSMGLGVSQRARAPKKINKLVNDFYKQDYTFLYSVAVRERDRGDLMEDILSPIDKKPQEGIFLLETPACYENRAIYENKYQGIPLDDVVFNKIEKQPPNHSSLYQLSQLLWACEGETDHATHGNRDTLDKNGFGRVHASGCAGYAVYPVIIIENLASLPKGGYWYNPVGFSGLNRWLKIDDKDNYDHLLHNYTSQINKTEIEKEFNVKYSHYFIMLCIDRKKPCSGIGHGTIGKLVMNTKYWAEVESGMALAGLQLQANALGMKWERKIISTPEKPNLRTLFHIDELENSINNVAENLVNLPKNERISLKGQLNPLILFFPA